MFLRSPNLLQIRSLQMGVFNPLLEDINLLPGTGGCFVAFGVDIYHKWPQAVLPRLAFGCPHAVFSSVLCTPIAELAALFIILSTETCLCISLHKTFMNYLRRAVCAGEQRVFGQEDFHGSRGRLLALLCCPTV